MIIRLMNADFSENNIGELTTWNISWKGDGYTYDGELPRSITKNEALNITVNVASGYTYDSVPITVKMGGTDVPASAISRNANGTITINIASVTGKLDILIGVASSGGEVDNTFDVSSIGVQLYNKAISGNSDTARISCSTNPYFEVGYVVTVGSAYTMAGAITTSETSVDKKAGSWDLTDNSFKSGSFTVATAGYYMMVFCKADGTAFDLSTDPATLDGYITVTKA